MIMSPRTWTGAGLGLLVGGFIASQDWHGPLGLIAGIGLMVAGVVIIVRFWGRPGDDDFGN